LSINIKTNMAMLIKDKDIDRRIEQITRNIKIEFGINCTKTDAIRYLLGIRKQGKKTNKKWKDIVKENNY